jgi:hypothetical protein
MFPPAKPAAAVTDAFFPVPRPGTTPEALQAIRRLRREAADEIERLLALLDALDGDPDLEPTLGYLPPGMPDEAEPSGDEGEPSLGWTEGEARFGCNPVFCGGADLELDQSDDEPSLGALEWATAFYVTHRNADGTARTVRLREGDQTVWAAGVTDDREDEHDREYDPAELGIADLDGLAWAHGATL